MENHRGTNNKQRLERLGNLRTEGFLDGEALPWLEKLLEVAACVKFHSPDGGESGRFDTMLPGLRMLAEKLRRGETVRFDGDMEPSEALLYVFIRNLCGIAQEFNGRWKKFPARYVTGVLGAADREPDHQPVWVALGKSTPGPLRLGEGLAFTLSGGGGSAALTLREDVWLDDAEVVCAMSVLYESDGKVYPCSALGAVSSVKISEVTGAVAAGRMFPYGEAPAAEQPCLAISSPTLLLCGGRRTVSITIHPENDPFGGFLSRAAELLPEIPGPELQWRLVNAIFKVRVSTAAGWEEPGGVAVKRSDESGVLTVRFVMGEEFPATRACTAGLHGIDTEFPAVKLSPDTGAWAYPYTWLKDFMVGRVDLDVGVEGLSSLQVYNALGRLDDSKPFAPFGTDTGKGAWFVVGSRELAVKNAPVCNLRIRWQDLPDDTDGMAGYYSGYRNGITNRTFLLESAYLEDYRWKIPEQTAPHYLFATVRGEDPPAEKGRLSPESVIAGIRVWDVAPYRSVAVSYDYGIASRDGFLRLRLAAPEEGFGRELYRRLYAESMRLRNLKKFTEPVPPYNPMVERMTLDYRSSETIDLRRAGGVGTSTLWHNAPTGWRRIYPGGQSGSVPLLYGTGEPANLIIALRAGAGSVVRLYFELTPLTEKPDRPVTVRWYWGDGYRWEPVTDGAILCDTTADLTISGVLELRLPGRIDGDVLWLRAGIAEGYRNLPALKRIVTNVARLTTPPAGITPAMREEGKIKPVKPVPGLRDIVTLTASVSAVHRSGDSRKIMRTSESVSHRGRAVTPRDYERLVLEEFPSVAEVKYILLAAGRSRRDVTLAVIPADPAPAGMGLGPKAGLELLARIEGFLRRVTSPQVGRITVVNPVYERVMVRCGIAFNGSLPYGSCRSRVKEICDRHIAPWYAARSVPCFDHRINKEALAAEIRADGCVESLRDLSLVTLSKEGRGRYSLAENGERKAVLSPSRPCAVFVPAAEHAFHAGSPGAFGLEEMTVGRNLVIC